MPRLPTRFNQLQPYWQTTDQQTVRLYQGDVLQVLQRLPSRSVHMAVTSPPYWGLRSYATGDEKHLEIGSEKVHDCLGWAKGFNCAEDDDWANGCHVCRMVLVFRELRRVLRDDGTLWLNYGDSYGQGGHLSGVPWRVALALQSDGWILRQDIIWSKPSPMPESCKNRCTKAHEYLFLLTKQQRYLYDADAIRKPYEDGYTGGEMHDIRSGTVGDLRDDGQLAVGIKGGAPKRVWESPYSGANKLSVWTVASGGYSAKHFATFPMKLIEPCILAGTSEHGCCTECGAPYKRVTEQTALKRYRPNDYVKRTGEEGTGNSCANTVAGVSVKTLGWDPTCECEGEVQPCTVLDPFIGSGTTCIVALKHGRRSLGIDLSAEYLDQHARIRVEGELLSRPALAHLSGLQTKPVQLDPSARIV